LLEYIKKNISKITKITVIVLVSIAVLLVGISLLTVFLGGNKNETGESVHIDKQPAIPDVLVNDDASLELSKLPATDMQWTTDDEMQSDEKGFNCISVYSNDIKIYNIDPANVVEDKPLSDFSYIWVDSETLDSFYVVINISGEAVDLSKYYILVRDDSTRYVSKLIINCYEAKSVKLDNTIINGTLLCPQAKIIFGRDTFIYGGCYPASHNGEPKYLLSDPFSGYKKIMDSKDTIIGLTDEVPLDPALNEAVYNELSTGAYADAYQGYTKDSNFTKSDFSRITLLDLSNTDITTLSGLELFPNLINLNCEGSSLESIDFTGISRLVNLNVSGTNLTSLDLSKLPNLELLKINSTNITGLDFSVVPKLNYLEWSASNLTSLDLTDLGNLNTLICDRNSISQIDLSKAPLLTELDISSNVLEGLDLSPLKDLVKLKINNCGLTEIDFSNNLKLNHIICYDNLFTTLDVSMLDNIEFLEAQATLGGLEAIFMTQEQMDNKVFQKYKSDYTEFIIK
jgi:choice-of-anchor A domain-containing protein